MTSAVTDLTVASPSLSKHFVMIRSIVTYCRNFSSQFQNDRESTQVANGRSPRDSFVASKATVKRHRPSADISVFKVFGTWIEEQSPGEAAAIAGFAWSSLQVSAQYRLDTASPCSLQCHGDNLPFTGTMIFTSSRASLIV